MAISKEQVQKIIKLKQEDFAVREDGGDSRSNESIANEVGTSERTVRRVWKSFKKDGEYRGVFATEQNAPIDEDFTLEEISDEVLTEKIKYGDTDYANLATRLRTAQRTNNQLRKIHRGIVDSENPLCLDTMLLQLTNNLKGCVTQPKLDPLPSTQKTVEILFSDLQIGKCSEYYNTRVAKRALVYYGKEVLRTIQRVKPEHIVFASLGDVVEDHLKHGVQSAISTDTGLAEQMADAIKCVWEDVLSPIAALGIPVTFIGIQGNHGSSEHKGMDMYQAGRYGYDYTIYKTWETLCAASGYGNVEFILPVGCFATFDIYGHKYLYEHGYSNQVNEKQMEDHKKKRQENLKQYIHGYRQGDKHHLVQYDNSNLICNGAFFGIEQQGAEYSGILGFNSIPVQAVLIHEPTTGVGQSSIVEVVQIQIAKGYNLGL